MTDFGFGDLPGKLVGNGIHTLENVMTLCTSFRIFFETLEVWLEAVVSGLVDLEYSHLVLKVCRMTGITRMLFDLGTHKRF